jgi:pimeloyl-ACP methyl ester carboxylesterase
MPAHLPDARPFPPRRAAALPAVLALLAALPATLLAAPRAVAAAPAPLALEDCRLQHPAGLGSLAARCGTLSVAEDPAAPAGRTIALRVAVIRALDRHRTREPLFIVAGGPGQAATDFYAAYASAFAPSQRSHDVVLVDQRGTGGSNRLHCEFPPDFDVATPPPARIRELSAACRRGLRGRPEFYTTSLAVRDLDAVRAALGFERIDLYGISYGTRVVEHYLRRYPARVGAVVLDGVLPPDASLIADTPLAAQRALELAFARCRADSACEQAFPELARRFGELRAELARRPRHLTIADPSNGAPRELDFDAGALAGAVRLLNYYAGTTALLPFLLDRATHDDYAPLAAQLLMLGAHLDAQLAYGMNVAVTCAEDVPSLVHADRAALAATYLGNQQVDGLAALCEGWPRGVVDADLYAPLDSAVPALLLSGEADPVTPPAYAARAAAGFRDRLHVVVRGQGHGQFAVGCAPRVIARFLDAGTARGLDASCLESATAPPFVIDLSGPAP